MLYQLRLEDIQKSVTDGLKDIVRNLEHCLISQDLTTDSFFDVVVERVKLGSYTNPKASKSFKLSQQEEGSIMQYLAMACPEPEYGTIHQVTIGSFLTCVRRASRTHHRMKLSENHKNTVVHFTKVLADHGTDIGGLFKYLDKDIKGGLDDDAELTDSQISVACAFIDGMGDGDGEVSLQELRQAFRAARTMVAQDDPDNRGKSKTERLAKAMKAVNITAEEFFNNVINKTNGGVPSAQEEEASIGQITLFKALSALSRTVAELSAVLEGFPFSDDDVLEIMEYLDPNKDGQVTLEEIEGGLRKVREGPSESESTSAAKLLKILESAMIEEGADLNMVFSRIDADNSGSVNTEELGEAIRGFHKRRLKRKQDAFMRSAERGKKRMDRARKTKSEVLESIEKWTKDHNIHSIDIDTRDIGVFMNFLDPFNDGEIKEEEINGFLEYMKGGARVDHEHEFRAARLLSRCAQAMFARRKAVWDLWDKGKIIEKEAKRDLPPDDGGQEGEEKKEEASPFRDGRNRNQSIHLASFDEEIDEFKIYDETLGVHYVVRAIGELVGEEINRGDKNKYASRAGRRGGDYQKTGDKGSAKATQALKIDVSKHALGTAITNAMSASNEPVEIFTPSHIVATEMFFCQNPYDVKNLILGTKDWKASVAKEEFVYGFAIAKGETEEDRGGLIGLARKAENIMEANGWTCNTSLDACKKVLVKDAGKKEGSNRRGESKSGEEATHAEVLIKDWIDVFHESPDEQEGQQSATRHNLDVMKAYKLQRIASSGVKEDGAVGRMTRAGRSEGHEAIKKEILKGIRLGKTGIRVSVRRGVWDKASDVNFHVPAWKNVFTGEAKDMEVADVVEGLGEEGDWEGGGGGEEESSRLKLKLSCFTIRCELITVQGRAERMVVSSYTPYVPPPPPR